MEQKSKRAKEKNLGYGKLNAMKNFANSVSITLLAHLNVLENWG